MLNPKPLTGNEAHIDCGACRACCHQIVVLDDRETGYDCDTHATPNGPVRLLKRQADGACIYLTDAGCSIYDARPAVCRLFDCGGWYKEAPRAAVKSMIREGGQYKRMAKEGRKRARD
jgi:Fe-S-cluster containining protein